MGKPLGDSENLLYQTSVSAASIFQSWSQLQMMSAKYGLVLPSTSCIGYPAEWFQQQQGTPLCPSSKERVATTDVQWIWPIHPIVWYMYITFVQYILSLTTYSTLNPGRGGTRLLLSQGFIFLLYPSSVLGIIQLSLLNPKHSVENLVHLVMFQTIHIDLADVLAGRTNPKSPGFGLELLMNNFCSIVSLA